jgi:hypothetical protein
VVAENQKIIKDRKKLKSLFYKKMTTEKEKLWKYNKIIDIRCPCPLR